MFILMLAAAFLLAGALPAAARPPLTDPVVLNIGLNCQWQSRCMKAQNKAMKHALKFLRKNPQPVWKIERCNHNAGRSGSRVDWVGYDHCLGNPSLTPLPPPPRAKPARHRKSKRRHRAR
jgi:hypothetical protein